jgi:hypothetical protein
MVTTAGGTSPNPAPRWARAEAAPSLPPSLPQVSLIEATADKSSKRSEVFMLPDEELQDQYQEEATAGSSRTERDRSAAARRELSPAPARAPDLDLGVIVVNDRDRRSLAWLVKQTSADAIREAVKRVPGHRRSYVSNVARVLGVELPRVLALPQADSSVRRALAEKVARLRR